MSIPAEHRRIELRNLEVTDARFIQALLNSPSWLTFIGDRSIHSLKDAEGYIEKINATPNCSYLVVVEASSGIPIGLLTQIQRDYLANQDFGFAFLPEYVGKGYAFSASALYLSSYFSEHSGDTLYAITLPHNVASIKLLDRLGFQRIKHLKREKEDLLLYAVNSSMFKVLVD